VRCYEARFGSGVSQGIGARRENRMRRSWNDVMDAVVRESLALKVVRSGGSWERGRIGGGWVVKWERLRDWAGSTSSSPLFRCRLRSVSMP